MTASISLAPRSVSTHTTIPPTAQLQARPNNADAIALSNTPATDDQSVATAATAATGTDLSSITTNDLLTQVYSSKGNLYLVRNVVCTHLFPKIKFVTAKHDLNYSMDEHSIAQIILTNLNIPHEPRIQMHCWAQNRFHVPQYMNRRRTAVTLALRNKFKGMSTSRAIISMTSTTDDILPLHSLFS